MTQQVAEDRPQWSETETEGAPTDQFPGKPIRSIPATILAQT